MRHSLGLSLMILAGALSAQDDSWQRILNEKVPARMDISGNLYQLIRLAEVAPDEALRHAREMKLLTRDDGAIYVELIMKDGSAFDRTPADRSAIELRSVWRDRATAWIGLAGMTEMMNDPDNPYRLRSTDTGRTTNEGPGVMNSAAYALAGADGTGLRIAVFDLGFDTLTEAKAAGVVPMTTVDTDHIGTGLESGPRHGTACLETTFDHAPGAQYYLHRVGGAADVGDAVNACINAGVDVITNSLAYFNQGWHDDDGPICAAFDLAAQNGILCFTSAGNYAAGDHYQGNWSDPDNDGIFNWSGANELNTTSVPAGGDIDIRLQWADDPDPTTDDYDLYLYDLTDALLVASSLSSTAYEGASWTNNNAVAHTVGVQIVQAGTDANDLEIFELNARNLLFFTPENSTACPANSVEPNVIVCGAVPWSDYGDPAGSSVIAGYSSLGPSNDGMMLPDLCGATNTTTFAYGGAFSGTSCATPNAAGAAAALWSAHPDYTADGIRQLILRKAELYKDWGTAGTEMTYGHGGLYLKSYLAGTEYVLEGSGNTTGTDDIPYSSMEQADQYAPPNSNVFFLGGTYPEPPPGTVLDTPMIYRSVKEDAVVQ
ncbi:MAG: S8 family serine peptidase [Flavobacteriales bacterium]|nr:S8 family serine peptidase [Flavobacteriales bacterium]